MNDMTEENVAMQGPAQPSVPSPDPTTITNQRVEQAKSDLRRDLSNLRELLTARMDAFEKNAELLRGGLEDLPGERQAQAQLLQSELDRRIVALDKADSETRDEIIVSIDHLHK